MLQFKEEIEDKGFASKESSTGGGGGVSSEKVNKIN